MCRWVCLLEKNADKKSAQLVFCDLSTPKNDGSFNVYDDIRTKLISFISLPRFKNIYTKIKDEPPTLYVKGCEVENSLIADGCIIRGKVKNSVIGRYVDIEDDVEIENCIILQNIRIHKGAKLSHVIIDKNVDIEEGTELKGNETFPLVIEKKNLFK